MTDNGQSWTWIVALMDLVGDVAMEVPSGILDSRKLPDEFTARNLTRFVTVPDDKGGTRVNLAAPLFREIDAMGDAVRVRASAISFWSLASKDAAKRLDGRWSVLATPTEAERAKILKGPGGK